MDDSLSIYQEALMECEMIARLRMILENLRLYEEFYDMDHQTMHVVIVPQHLVDEGEPDRSKGIGAELLELEKQHWKED
ncbi:hypothetical protein Tco_0215265 [Tanacetum coccineum]